MVTMNEEVAKKLREPFDPKVVGKLPRVWCRACSDAKRQGGTCQQHTKVKCRECNNNITSAHLHLDYVGHAETTDRFLSVDPTWTWEPVAFGPDGLPLMDSSGGLWIRLTIAGVTRLGYGHAGDKRGGDAIKEAIGDALRNAGMRFGVALDLWGATFKDGEHEPIDDDPPPARRPQAVNTPNGQRPPTDNLHDFQSLMNRTVACTTDKELAMAWQLAAEASKKGQLTKEQSKQLREAWDRAHLALEDSKTPEKAAA